MSFTKFKMDEITGERVSMTHLEIYYRFEHMFFNKAAKESWQMLSSGSLQTVQAYANLKKAISNCVVGMLLMSSTNMTLGHFLIFSSTFISIEEIFEWKASSRSQVTLGICKMRSFFWTKTFNHDLALFSIKTIIQYISQIIRDTHKQKRESQEISWIRKQPLCALSIHAV